MKFWYVVLLSLISTLSWAGNTDRTHPVRNAVDYDYDFRHAVVLTLLDSTAVRGETRVTHASLHFRWDKADYEDSYLNNADAAKQLVDFLSTIGQEYMDSVTVVAYASPEGVYEHNMKLCRRRAQEFTRVLKDIGGAGIPVNVKVGGEAWDLLRQRVAADEKMSETARERVLKVIDDNSVGPDTKKWRFLHGALGTTPEEGDVYKYLVRHHYRYLRSMDISIHYKEEKSNIEELEAVTTPEEEILPEPTPVEPEPEPEVVKPEPQATSSDTPLVPLPDLGDILPRRAVLGVSTNIPYDITWVPQYGVTSIPSFSVEYYPLAGHYTFGGDVEWPMWQHPSEHRYLQINNITLWARRYFKPVVDRYSGPYALANVNFARYGIGFNAEKGWEGEGLGASVGAGFKHYMGRRIYLDAGLVLGVFYSAYDPYSWGDDATQRYYYDYYGDPDKFKRRNNRLFWFGPTRIYFSIGIDLFSRKR